MISKLDFLAVPSQDAERSRAFYVDTLGLRPDDKARFEFWAGDTCFAIYEPKSFGMEFAAAPEPVRDSIRWLPIGVGETVEV